jgi:hypothetical protein
VTHHLEGFAQEAIRRSGVAAVGQHEVDELTVLVDGAEQIFPLAANPHVGLADAPRARTRSLVLADPPLDLGRIALNPAKDRAWVDADTTLFHHLSQVAVADPVFAGPAHAQQDDLDRKPAAFEDRQQSGSP